MNYKKVTSTIACFLSATMLFSIRPVSAGASKDFTDVSSDAWYAEAVGYVTDSGLFNGVTDELFLPNGVMTRAMFVTVLGRYAGVEQSESGVGVISKTDVNLRSEPNTSSAVLALLQKGDTVDITGSDGEWFRVSVGGNTGYVRSDLMDAYSSVFTDVSYGSYFGAYVRWAYTSGLVNGTSETYFSPSRGISREQLCKILYEYLEYTGTELILSDTDSDFTDSSAISFWAVEAVDYMHSSGVISGRENGSFDPKATATRAEVAAIMLRFDAAIESAKKRQPEQSPDDESYSGYTVFGNAVQASGSVAMSYFDDALFIGHSIVCGMSQSYMNLFPDSGFYAVNSGTTVGILGAEALSYTGVVRETDGTLTVKSLTGSLDDALSGFSYSKVYIMLGINEMSNSETFCNNLSKIISAVRTRLGSPRIYLISVTPLSRNYTENSDYFSLSNILAYNSALMQLSIDESVYYLDLFSALCGDDGYIADEYTRDGVHLSAEGYSVVLEYLKTHTV